MKWGTIGLFIGLISVLTGGGLSGFLNALFLNPLPAYLCSFVWSFWSCWGWFYWLYLGTPRKCYFEEPEVTRSESDCATLVSGSTISSVVKEGQPRRFSLHLTS